MLISRDHSAQVQSSSWRRLSRPSSGHFRCRYARCKGHCSGYLLFILLASRLLIAATGHVSFEETIATNSFDTY